MKWMKETRKETAMASAQELLPTIEDEALLSAVSGGAESVHLYRKAPGENGRFFPVDNSSPRLGFFTYTNGGVTHEDS